jgi:dUTP pyrophosphatase
MAGIKGIPVIGQMPKLGIKIKYFDKSMPKLTVTEKGDWVDLRIAEAEVNGEPVLYDENGELSYKAGDVVKFNLGVAMQLPNNAEAHVLPRSSTFKHYGLILVNSVGMIDNCYCGDDDQWIGMFYALKDGKVAKYDRLLQFRIMLKMPPVLFQEVEKLGNPNRGGIGSTGVK